MPQVLHLVEISPSHQTQVSLGMLRGQGEGLHDEVRINPRWFRAAWQLRRRIADAPIVHAWGANALATAIAAGAARVLFSPEHFPKPRVIRWLRAAMAYAPIEIACPTDTLRRAVVERGVPFERCHLIRPGADFSALKPRRDPQIRRALGFCDEDIVILPCDEAHPQAHHRLAIWAGAILHVFDPRYRVLLWGTGPAAARTERYAVHLQSDRFMTVATRRLGGDVDFPTLLSAADVVIVSSDRTASTQGIVMAMASGVPIVATASATTAELLEDRHNALMCRPEPRALSQRILDIHRDPQRLWAITDQARAEAFESFSKTRFVDAWRRVYGLADQGCLRQRVIWPTFTNPSPR